MLDILRVVGLVLVASGLVCWTYLAYCRRMFGYVIVILLWLLHAAAYYGVLVSGIVPYPDRIEVFNYWATGLRLHTLISLNGVGLIEVIAYWRRCRRE